MEDPKVALHTLIALQTTPSSHHPDVVGKVQGLHTNFQSVVPQELQKVLSGHRDVPDQHTAP